MPVPVSHCLGKAIALLWLIVDASAASAAPPRQWGEEALAKLKNEPGLLVSLMITSSTVATMDDAPFLNGLEEETYFGLTSGAEVALMVRLNRTRLEGEADLATQARLAMERFVLVAETGDDWRLLQVVGKKTSEVFEATPPGAYTEPSIVADWLFAKLGWDGVVLARNGDQVLVGSSRSKLQRQNLQAVAIQKSERLLQIRTKRGSGALLTLVERDGPFAVFRILFLGEGSTLPVGTKLIFEAVK